MECHVNRWGTIVIVRIDVEAAHSGRFDYRVSLESEDLYADQELDSVVECLVAAVEGMAPEVVGAEVAYGGIVSGTYPLQVIGMNVEQIAEHALNTTAAIEEASGRA